MNSLLGIADHSGWLPDAHIACNHAYMQSACAADILFSEAARKGIRGVDYEKALEYCAKNALEVSPDPMVAGRYIEDFNRNGYVSTATGKSCVSRHLEYTYYDWCIARLAELTGNDAIRTAADERARKVWALWNDENKVFWPKDADGNWVSADQFDPSVIAWERWNEPYS